MYRVIITGPAKRDIQSAHDWWAENRSVEQAHRWYLGIHEAITSLKQMPQRCSHATEQDLLEQGFRQMLFGLGRHPTHRVVFAMDGKEVVVLRVRHVAQDVLTSEDLE
ncbi:MAG: type II toxin-antitoxin system RelE/ParE family toxin [Planctomycetes bacterium]|nr:type II toxin-antitoxin system RelE/ParE family toxin [Planctomycetota bacterium]